MVHLKEKELYLSIMHCQSSKNSPCNSNYIYFFTSYIFIKVSYFIPYIMFFFNFYFYILLRNTDEKKATRDTFTIFINDILTILLYCLEQIQRKGSKILPPGTRLCKQCSISLQSLIKVSFPVFLDPLLWKYYIKNDRSELMNLAMPLVILFPRKKRG